MAQKLTSTSTGKSDIIQKIEVGVGVTSDWFLLPSAVDELGLELLPAGGDAKVQASLDGDGAAATPPTAVGVDWEPGLVSVNTQILLEGAAAIRVIGGTGSAVLHVRGTLL